MNLSRKLIKKDCLNNTNKTVFIWKFYNEIENISNKNEIWKPIQDFPEYKVSNYGNVINNKNKILTHIN